MRRSISRFGLALAAIVAGTLTACEPPPPPDGRDLGISIVTPLTAHLVPGQVTTAEVGVHNHGTFAVDGVRLGLLTFANLDVHVTDTQSVGDCPPQVGELLTCNRHVSLMPGETWIVTVEVQAGALGSGNLLIGASSAGTEPAVDPHPNTHLLTTSVGSGGTVDLQAGGWSWAGSAPVPTVGVPMYSYTTVTNDLGHAFGVTVTQELPVGFVIHEASFGHSDPADPYEEGSCEVVGQTVTCTTGDTPGHWISNWDDTVEWLMQVRATPSAPGSFVIAHDVQSDHPEPAPDPHANASTHPVTVVPA